MSDGRTTRSLESLKKEAKRWLAALDTNDPEAIARLQRATPDASPPHTLRAVQHALALELGYTGWTELKSRRLINGAAVAETLAFYEVRVDALLDAYRTGTPEAMERHYSMTWHRRVWSAMRTYVQIGLGYQAADDIEISREEAQWLIAREHGFEDWPALLRAVTSAERPQLLTVKPMGLIANDRGEGREPFAYTRDWQDALSELAEPEVIGLDAHGQMNDALLRELRDLTHLTTLRLGGSRDVTDESIRLLLQFPNLQVLDLSSTSITDAAIALLCELPALQRVSLAWTRVTDDGLRALSRRDGTLHHLASIDLTGTRCGDGAIHACTQRPALQHFRSGAATTDRGLALFHEFPRFAQWTDPDPSVASWWSESHTPTHLVIRGAVTDAGIASLAGLHGLGSLDLDDSALRLTGRSLEPLVDMAHLQSLWFDAHDDAMAAIARLPHLRVLGVQDAPATDAGWQALGASRSIEHIWGRRCHGLENAGFRALSTMPRLRYLSASCRNVHDSALAALPDFPSLRELMPMDIPDAGYRHIAKCTELEALTLMYCRDTSDVATEHLTALPHLARYFASYTQITDRTPALLSTIPSLEEITFDSCAGLTNAGIAHLAALPRLRTLRISGRALTSAVARAFPAQVSVHYSL